MNNFSIIQKSQLEGANRIDAEYYQPEYLQYSNNLNKLVLEDLNTLTSKIDVGFVSSMTSHFQDSGIPLLRTQNVHEFFTDVENDTVFIDEEFHKKLKKSQIFPGYLLLARSGSIGNVSVVTKNFPVANSADIILIKIKSNKIIPEFLAAFLNSKYGRFQIERGSSGGLQGHINLFSLEKLNIPLFDLNLQRKIESLVLQGLSSVDESKNLYLQAEELLLEELGLKNVIFEDDLSYIVNFSDISEANRMDAEYFQPKYQEIIEKMEEYKGGFDLVKNQFKQNKSLSKKDKDHYNYVEISDINVSNGEITPNKIAKQEIPANGKITLCQNDLLISKVRPYRGAVSFIDFKIEDLLGSGAFTVLQEKNTYKKEVLMIFLKLDFIKDLLLKYNCGTSYPVIKDENILNLKIPLIKSDIQEEIVKLVRKSHEARKKSKELLEEAKRKVEEMIEKGAK